ncbi:MAG TPA: thioredoxin domain-containing protein [Myxococcales bacterium]|jgi:protein-disulfide isomerase
MKNSQVLMAVAGTALVGLLLGNLVSRRPEPAEAQSEREREPAREVARAAAPSRAPAREVEAAPPPRGPAPAAGAARPKKKAVSDERKVVEVHSQDPAVGPTTAKVTIVEFSDFQCPYCGRASKTVGQIKEQYGDQVRLVFKQHPLPFHDKAALAAQAAAEANAQGNFWGFHDRLFANQKALAREDLESAAQATGLDMARFRSALDSGVHQAHVQQDTAQAGSLGATGTPAFFINGRLLSGAQPIEVFKQAIDEELARP